MMHIVSTGALVALLVAQVAALEYAGSPLASAGAKSLEREILWRFLEERSRDPGSHLDQWSLSLDHCGWAGVECSPDGHVAKLFLDSCGLDGQLPESFSELSRLTHLHLSGNKFCSQLPEAWSAMHSLEELSLKAGTVRGPLPSGWSSMGSLRSLDLSYNALTGTLPSEWSAMGQASPPGGLEQLVLWDNALTGPLPSEWSAWTALQALDVSYNSLSVAVPGAWSSLGQAGLAEIKLEPQSGKPRDEAVTGRADCEDSAVNGDSLAPSPDVAYAFLGQTVCLDRAVLQSFGSIASPLCQSLCSQQTACGAFTFDVRTGSCELRESCFVSESRPTGFSGLKNEEGGQCYQSRWAYDRGIYPVKACRCHPSCGACGFGSWPVGPSDCLSCADGRLPVDVAEDGTGVCPGASAPGGRKAPQASAAGAAVQGVAGHEETSGGGYAFLPNTVCLSVTIETLPATAATECVAACDQSPGCIAFTFFSLTGSCWLKADCTEKAVGYKDFVSGVENGRQ